MGSLPPSKGYNYLLHCIALDSVTPWPEAFPLTNITAESVSQTFLSGWISRFGIPSTITTDHRKQFESTLWHHLMKYLGCKCLHTTTNHPMAKGILECFHCQLESDLKYLNPTNWTNILLVILLGICTAVKDDLHCTSAKLVYHTTLRLYRRIFQFQHYRGCCS